MANPLERRFVVVDGPGLHARTATRFARIAAGFQAAIEVARAGATGDGKNVMDVLMLVATAGDEITIRASGPDAPAALEALSDVVRGELGVPSVGSESHNARVAGRPDSRDGAAGSRDSRHQVDGSSPGRAGVGFG
jgi:phosphocarrier protein HPr